ncbi:MAG: ribonuclease P protein component [Armatimonadota bacterium]
MLQKQHRLTSSRDFKRVFAGGRTYVHRLLILKIMPTVGEQPSRFGFSTSTKLGNSVTRNRAKRLFRESVRLFGDTLNKSGYDAVIIARPPVREADMADISRAVAELFRKAGLLKRTVQAQGDHQDN